MLDKNTSLTSHSKQ